MMMVLYVFSLTFTFSNTFGIKWWSIFKQAKNQHSKAEEGLLSSSHQVRCGSKHGVSNPRGSQPSAPGLLFGTLSGKWQEITLRNPAR